MMSKLVVYFPAQTRKSCALIVLFVCLEVIKQAHVRKLHVEDIMFLGQRFIITNHCDVVLLISWYRLSFLQLHLNLF